MTTLNKTDAKHGHLYVMCNDRLVSDENLKKFAALAEELGFATCGVERPTMVDPTGGLPHALRMRLFRFR